MINFSGLYSAFCCFFFIGFGFFWVIRIERFWGSKLWPLVLILGLFTVFSSLFIVNFYLCAAVGILGGTIIWGAFELPEQSRRSNFKKGMGK